MLKLLLAFIVLFSGIALQAQTGEGALQTAKTAESNDWKSWTFVGVTVLIAAGAVIFISLDNGAEVPSSH